VAKRLGHRHATRRDGEHEAVAVLAGQLHRPRSEAGDVERNARLEVHVLPLVHQHRDGPRDAGERIVHDLTAEQGAQHPQVLVVVGDPHRALPHRPHGGVAGADREVHAPRREAVQRGHRRDVHGRDPRAADGRARAQAQPARLPGRKCQHRVAVGEQHLAVGHPDRVVAERLGMVEKADLVDVGHHADSEAHSRAASTRREI